MDKDNSVQDPIAAAFGSRHHYELAHRAIRGYCNGNPGLFFKTMQSPHKARFLLEMIWDAVCANCDDGGQASFSSSDIEIDSYHVNECPCIVFTMPTPANMAEAHFVGIVLHRDTDPEWVPDGPRFRYFTLEKGLEKDDSERTVLCEWTADGTHLNYGDGPETKKDLFIEAITEKLESSTGPSASYRPGNPES